MLNCNGWRQASTTYRAKFNGQRQAKQGGEKGRTWPMLLWLSSGRASGSGGGRRGWRSGHAVEEEESVRLTEEEELAPLGIKLPVWGFWRPKLGAGHRAPPWPVWHWNLEQAGGGMEARCNGSSTGFPKNWQKLFSPTEEASFHVVNLHENRVWNLSMFFALARTAWSRSHVPILRWSCKLQSARWSILVQAPSWR
jgi:hypothetical protein